MLLRLLLAALLVFPVALAQADYAQRFEAAWRLVDERYWDPAQGGVDWQAIRREYQPQALAAPNDEAFYQVLEAMYEELGDGHSVFVPPKKVEEIRMLYGDLPCLGVFSWASPGGRLGHVRYRVVDHELGYIELPDLATPGIAGSVREAVRQLESRDVTGLILDLRGNPGGRLIEMMQAAGIFTSGFLWRTVTRWALPLPYPAIGPIATSLPLVVLVDADVNSAAEGLAGALQAQGRATVIGETTAGNVEAVLPFCFRDGSQAWIATGVLAPLRGPTWEGRGVVPDIATRPGDALDEAIRYLGQQR
ncbi:MAG TPA: S41 family peptidase [Trueperaceae bacterium]